MDVKHAFDVTAEPIEELEGVTIRWLWAEKDGVPHFALRLFEVQPGASTFYHTHTHEHETTHYTPTYQQGVAFFLGHANNVSQKHSAPHATSLHR